MTSAARRRLEAAWERRTAIEFQDLDSTSEIILRHDCFRIPLHTSAREAVIDVERVARHLRLGNIAGN